MIDNNDRRMDGDPVIAYTPTSAEEYKSLSEASRVYGISRKKIQALIENGAVRVS